jgi:hypothetical protein
VVDLVTTLRRADTLVERMRAMRVETQTLAAPETSMSQAPSSQTFLSQAILARTFVPYRRPVAPSLARLGFSGKSVGVILLIVGTLCVLAAGAVFVAVEWLLLPLAIRTLILVAITAGFGFLAHLALGRRLQSTAEAMAAIASGMFILDIAAARRVDLFGLGELAIGTYEIVAGALLVVAAGAGAFAVRSRQRWLWSLDAAVALGIARAAVGALRLSGEPYAVSIVTVTIVASLLYVGCRRLRFPVARWSAAAIGAMGWLAAVAVGTGRAADPIGDDLSRIGVAWPALVMALLAGLWSIRLSRPVWRRVAAGLTLLPVLLVLEIVGWSHGWVVGALVMLVAYVVAALASGRVPGDWSPAAGVSALVLGLSAVVGLLPTLATLANRLELATIGIWPTSNLLPLDLPRGDVAPWLLPVTVLAILAVLPQVTVGSHRHALDPRTTAGAVVAALAVLPILYGAGFWVSIVVLVVVAAALLGGARLWRNDVLLLLGLILLLTMRISAYYDNLADCLAWTVIALAALVWALSERRPKVAAWFLTAAGLSALFAAVQWLSFAQVPGQYQGLVIVVIGSLGMLASQSLHDRALSERALPDGALCDSRLHDRAVRRLVCEGLSATWVLAGLAMADSSPSHRALELTVAGVAAGIIGYLSEDRRRAGWVSGVLLTLASWIRLMDSNIQTVEWYTLPAAAALLVYGTRRLSQDSGEGSWRCLGPGLALALTPSLLLALDEPISSRGLLVGLASVALVALGVRVRLAAPFALGVVATALLALRYVWPVTAFIPRWTLLFLIGGAFLGAGMTWESRVNDVRTASRYVRGLR